MQCHGNTFLTVKLPTIIMSCSKQSCLLQTGSLFNQCAVNQSRASFVPSYSLMTCPFPPLLYSSIFNYSDYMLEYDRGPLTNVAQSTMCSTLHPKLVDTWHTMSKSNLPYTVDRTLKLITGTQYVITAPGQR